jgi:hypothetical protein
MKTTTGNRVFNQEPDPPATILYHIITSGRFFAAFYGPSKMAAEAAAALRLGRGGGGNGPAADRDGAAAAVAPPSHVIDIYDRGSRQRKDQLFVLYRHNTGIPRNICSAALTQNKLFDKYINNLFSWVSYI